MDAKRQGEFSTGVGNAAGTGALQQLEKQRPTGAAELTVAKLLHQLCQPLTSIECNVELALQQTASPEAQRLLRAALQSCRVAARTVTAFRRIVDIAGKFRKRKGVDFRNLCESALQRRLMACARDVQSAAAGSWMVHLDADGFATACALLPGLLGQPPQAAWLARDTHFATLVLVLFVRRGCRQQ